MAQGDLSFKLLIENLPNLSETEAKNVLIAICAAVTRDYSCWRMFNTHLKALKQNPQELAKEHKEKFYEATLILDKFTIE